MQRRQPWGTRTAFITRSWTALLETRLSARQASHGAYWSRTVWRRNLRTVLDTEVTSTACTIGHLTRACCAELLGLGLVYFPVCFRSQIPITY